MGLLVFLFDPSLFTSASRHSDIDEWLANATSHIVPINITNIESLINSVAKYHHSSVYVLVKKNYLSSKFLRFL